ncbi:TPA: hypothetical protein ACK3Q6_004434 [Burkholderia cepacia]
MKWLLGASILIGFPPLICAVFGPAVLGGVMAIVGVGIYVWLICRKVH